MTHIEFEKPLLGSRWTTVARKRLLLVESDHSVFHSTLTFPGRTDCLSPFSVLFCKVLCNVSGSKRQAIKIASHPKAVVTTIGIQGLIETNADPRGRNKIFGTKSEACMNENMIDLNTDRISWERTVETKHVHISRSYRFSSGQTSATWVKTTAVRVGAPAPIICPRPENHTKRTGRMGNQSEN